MKRTKTIYSLEQELIDGGNSELGNQLNLENLLNTFLCRFYDKQFTNYFINFFIFIILNTSTLFLLIFITSSYIFFLVQCEHPIILFKIYNWKQFFNFSSYNLATDIDKTLTFSKQHLKTRKLKMLFVAGVHCAL